MAAKEGETDAHAHSFARTSYRARFGPYLVFIIRMPLLVKI